MWCHPAQLQDALYSQGQGAPWAQAPLKSGRVEMLAASGCKIAVFDCGIKSQMAVWNRAQGGESQQQPTGTACIAFGGEL